MKSNTINQLTLLCGVPTERGKMIEKYMKHLKKCNYSKNTIKTYKSILSQYEDFFADIRNIKRALLKNQTPNTIWTHYNVLISFMKWSKDKRWVSLTELKLPKIPTVYRDVFTKEFLMKKTKNLDDYRCVVIRFLFETGIRAEEIKNIISIKKDSIIVKGKGNKIREIFHNPETTKLFKGFIFTTKTLRVWVKEILGKKYTPHSIRRSHATHMLLKGANPKSVMMQLGHSKVETTYRYLQLSREKNKNIYQKYFLN